MIFIQVFSVSCKGSNVYIQHFLTWNSHVSDYCIFSFVKQGIPSPSTLSFLGPAICKVYVHLQCTSSLSVYKVLIGLPCETSVPMIGVVPCSLVYGGLHTSRGSTLILILQSKGSHCWCGCAQPLITADLTHIVMSHENSHVHRRSLKFLHVFFLRRKA